MHSAVGLTVFLQRMAEESSGNTYLQWGEQVEGFVVLHGIHSRPSLA